MPRIYSIDTIRGFCLINIFVAHIGHGVFQLMSPSRLLLCDTSDIFVFLAGVCASLRCAGRSGFSFRQAMPFICARTARIYGGNIVVIGLSLPILTVSSAIDPPSMLAAWPQAIVRADGMGAYVWSLVSLQQNIGFSVVLRLYVFLTVVTPLLIWCSARRWWLPLLPAAAIWLPAGHFALVLPNSLTGDTLSMTLLPWTFIFAAGVSLGAAIKQRITLPRTPMVDGLAVGIMGASLLSITVAVHLLPELLDWYRTRNDFFWTGGSKTLQSPLRVLSLFALVWVFLRFPHAPVIRLLHEAARDDFLSVLGRRPLPVFCFGAVYSLLIDETLRLLIDLGPAPRASLAAGLVELAGVASGIAVMRWIALQRTPRAASGAFARAAPAFFADAAPRETAATGAIPA